MPPQPQGPDFGTIFLVLIVLSFIPGPWQVITNPLLNLINLFYMAKFSLFLLAILAAFGFGWWIEQTTAQGQCPNCGAVQVGSKSEPFQCQYCGEDLQFKDEVFQRYVKSGKVEGTAFDKLGDFVQEAAKSVKKATPTTSSSGSPSSSKKKPVEVVDAEVL